MSKKKKIKVATQEFLDIAEIKENIIVLKDGTIRALLLISSINFALKSEDEQNAIISAYVSFLNNISFPVQIVIQSRKFNIEGYLADLKVKAREQINELLKIQTNEYMNYVQELVSMGNIMNKRFFISIPYNPLTDKHKNFLQSLRESFVPRDLVKLKHRKFQRYKKEIELRIDSVMSALASIGVKSAVMDTQSIIELFYNTYNPSTSPQEKMTDIKNLRIKE
ncbi:hypothetical protein K8R62_02825 [bacterium]|nr:hypothetical protein [bacterium]